jgi:hypothetical protein
MDGLPPHERDARTARCYRPDPGLVWDRHMPLFLQRWHPEHSAGIVLAVAFTFLPAYRVLMVVYDRTASRRVDVHAGQTAR